MVSSCDNAHMQAILSARFLGSLLALALLLIVPQLVEGAQVNISAQDSFFGPKNVTVNQGDIVHWTNNGATVHTVTADSGIFNSGTLSPGQTFAWQFNAPGIYPYYCSLHGGKNGVGMAGSVTVAAAGTVVQQTQTQTTSSGNATVDALRAQIQDLLNRISALQSQVGGSPAPVVGVPVAAGTVQCPLISRSLKLGSQGDDVMRLQRFLALDPAIYPEALATGYYGALTEAAVKRFQCKNKLVCEGTAADTGYGVTGPRTAALLALQCPDVIAGSGGGGGSSQGNVGGYIRITPISGGAPLPVAIEAVVNTTRSCTGGTYELDYGDNSARTQIVVPPNQCGEMRQVFNHTYTSLGSFVVTLRSGVHQTSGTVVVSGSGQPGPNNPTTDTLTATPTSGQAPITITFKGVVNAANACNAGPYTLNFGDGQSVAIPLSGCGANAYNVTHQYQSSGNFVARLYKGNPAVDIGSISLAITSQYGQGGSYGAYFAVTPGTGGSVFSVTAQFDIEASCTAFDLDWGDGSAHQMQSQGTCSTGVVSKSFSHTYDSAGTYTIMLKRGSGLSATDTAGITITD